MNPSGSNVAFVFYRPPMEWRRLYLHKCLSVSLSVHGVGGGVSKGPLWPLPLPIYIITVSNSSCGKACFYSCLSVHGGGVHLPDRHPRQSDPPTAAEGTHPTGMHSCLYTNLGSVWIWWLNSGWTDLTNDGDLLVSLSGWTRVYESQNSSLGKQGSPNTMGQIELWFEIIRAKSQRL